MKYLLLSIILLAICWNSGYTQDEEQDLCQRTGNQNTQEIKKRYPFDKMISIKVVSFKPLNKKIEWGIPKRNGQVDLTKLFEVKTLNSKQTAKLLDLLVNINYIPLPPTQTDIDSIDQIIERDIRISDCYTPRHAILLLDASGKVFSYIEICLECLRYKTQPKDLEIGDFCYEKYTMLEDFFRDLGIAYGIGKNGYRWMGD